MFMTATVIRIESRGLLVRNMANGQEVFVNFSNPGLFRPGDTVRIAYTGTMTFSIPPQISATSVVRVSTAQPPRPPACQCPQCPPQPSFSEIRNATIIRVGRNVLLVRNPVNNQQVTVNYPNAHFFRVGQRVNIRYETAFLNGGYTVNATDVSLVC